MQEQFAEIFDTAKTVMEYCQVDSTETAIVFNHTGKNRVIVDAFYTAASTTDAEVLAVTTTTPRRSLIDPPEAAVEAMIKADIVFDCSDNTSKWLYTEATNLVLDSGTRMLQVTGTEDSLIDRPPAEFIRRREEASRDLLEGCSEFRITSQHGTDFVLQRGDRPIHTQGGFVDRPGDWDSLGTYLAAFAPPENCADGSLALHGTMHLPPSTDFVTEEPINLTVESGVITDIEEDHEQARLLADWLRSWHDQHSYVIAHTGFGFDHRASVHPFDPSAWESIAAGVNVAFGGNNIPQLNGETACASHFDAVLLDASAEVDGQRIIDEGEFVEGFGFSD